MAGPAVLWLASLLWLAPPPASAVNVIQFGRMRTGTTEQYQAIAAAMGALHFDDIDSLSVSFHGHHDIPRTADGSKDPNATYVVPLVPGKNNIIKLHDMPEHQTPSGAFLWPEPAEDLWVFTTTVESVEQLKTLGYNVKFAGNMTVARSRGVSMAIEYNKVFGLDAKQAGMVATFLRYFNILRQCCGVQMSMDWRHTLSWGEDNPTGHRGRLYRRHHQKTSLGYPACEMYDIDQVEGIFMNTTLSRRFIEATNTKVRRLARPSMRDCALDGTYCRRYNEETHNKHLRMNHGIQGTDC